MYPAEIGDVIIDPRLECIHERLALILSKILRYITLVTNMPTEATLK